MSNMGRMPRFGFSSLVVRLGRYTRRFLLLRSGRSRCETSIVWLIRGNGLGNVPDRGRRRALTWKRKLAWSREALIVMKGRCVLRGRQAVRKANRLLNGPVVVSHPLGLRLSFVERLRLNQSGRRSSGLDNVRRHFRAGFVVTHFFNVWYV